MGMSIDKAISHLYTYSSTHGSGITTDDQHEEAKRIAIDTMRKYQKIEEIIADWKNDGGAFEMSESYWLKLIREVVEDGKID